MWGNYKCDICGEIFDSEDLCVNHVKTVHKIEYWPRSKCLHRMYECPNCWAKFVSEEDYKYHYKQSHIPECKKVWVNL